RDVGQRSRNIQPVLRIEIGHAELRKEAPDISADVQLAFRIAAGRHVDRQAGVPMQVTVMPAENDGRDDGIADAIIAERYLPVAQLGGDRRIQIGSKVVDGRAEGVLATEEFPIGYECAPK